MRWFLFASYHQGRLRGRAKNVLEEDCDAKSITVSRAVKKYTRKIVEEKFDD